MKKTLHYLSIITLSVLSVIGVSYLQAEDIYDEDSVWQGPIAEAPNSNTFAPINVGPSSQVKEGGLSLGSLLVNGGSIFNGLLKIPTNAGNGKVLTSDAEGNATWQDSIFTETLFSTPSVIIETTDGITYPARFTVGSGLNSVPSGAKALLIESSFDGSATRYAIQYKWPSQSSWKNIFVGNAYYGMSDTTWLPLDSNGRLEIRIVKCNTDGSGVSSQNCSGIIAEDFSNTAVQYTTIKIHGYRK